VIIMPLFRLYVEQKNAVRMEASRTAGIEAFGRTASEVQQDINQMENETLPAEVFQPRGDDHLLRLPCLSTPRARRARCAAT
jgi:hypothetical protein